MDELKDAGKAASHDPRRPAARRGRPILEFAPAFSLRAGRDLVSTTAAAGRTGCSAATSPRAPPRIPASLGTLVMEARRGGQDAGQSLGRDRRARRGP